MIYPRNGVANVFFKLFGIYPVNLCEADILHLLKPVNPPIKRLALVLYRYDESACVLLAPGRGP